MLKNYKNTCEYLYVNNACLKHCKKKKLHLNI